MAGRPSKLNKERVDLIDQALRAGGSIANAAARAHIAPATYHEWQSRGLAALEEADWDLDAIEGKERPYAEFADTVIRARQDWELSSVAQIMRAGHGQPYEKVTTSTKEMWVWTNKDAGEGHKETLTDTRIERGVTYDWRALFELLRARNPKEYGRLTRTEISGPEGAPIEMMNVEDEAAAALAKVDDLTARRNRKAG